MADQKKFLDSAGVTILWDRIKAHVTEQTDPIVADVEVAKTTATEAKTAAIELESYIGSIPDDYEEETVIAYIDKKAEETLAAASGNSSETAASVKKQLDDYKTENNAKVSKNADDILAIQEDYLTSDDKTELQNQINTIMNNPDTEGIINSIEEFTQYIEDHGEIAEGFRTDINTLKNKVDTGDKTVSAYVDAKLAAANYASKDEVSPLQAKVDTGDQTVTAYVTAQVNAAETRANQYTDTAFGNIIALSQSEIDTAIAAAAGNA